MRAKFWIVMVVLWMALPTFGQGAATPTLLTYGTAVTGRLDDRTPTVLYQFEGLRGEFVRVTLTVTTGALDAVLVVSAPDGQVLVARDEDDEAGQLMAQLRLPSNGEFGVTVGRFGYGYGTTSGGYRIQVDRLGVSAESGSGLRYGDTVANAISDDTPEVYYSFRARQGDLVTLAMRRDGGGTLDPLVQIVDANRRILIEADDYEGSPDARIERWQVPADGQYLIVATRYGGVAGRTTGAFLLTLSKVPDSALGSSAGLAIQVQAGVPTERDITAERYEVWYVFEARAGQRVSISLARVNGSLDPFLVLLGGDLTELASHDDLVDGKERDSLIENFEILADGKYYVLATRFERAAGTTIGRFRLRIEIAG